MKNKITSILFCAIAAIACTKKEREEDLYIRGRLFLTDTIILNKTDSPLAGKKVLLSEDNGDTLNYLYSTTTDTDGYFIFDLINDGKNNFVVRFEESINGNIYTGKVNTAKGQTNVLMPARLNTIKQNGFYGRTKDILGGGMPNTTVSIYNSLVLANLNINSGAVETLTTDNTGRFYKTRIAPGTYYLRAKKTVGTTNFESLVQRIDVFTTDIKLIDPLVLQ